MLLQLFQRYGELAGSLCRQLACRSQFVEAQERVRSQAPKDVKYVQQIPSGLCWLLCIQYFVF